MVVVPIRRPHKRTVGTVGGGRLEFVLEDFCGHWSHAPYDVGMPKSNDGIDHTLPAVRACAAARSLSTSNRELTESTSAHRVALPVPVTAPSVTATVVTLRPFGVRAVGPVSAAPAPKFLLPSAFVVVASAKSVGSLQQI